MVRAGEWGVNWGRVSHESGLSVCDFVSFDFFTDKERLVVFVLVKKKATYMQGVDGYMEGNS